MSQRNDPTPAPALREALAVAALLGLVLLAVLVTYARLEPAELYRVSTEGPAGGLGRALVLINFPVALVAIAVAALAADRLRSPRADAVALAAVLLCALVAVPGVVDPDDLDARRVNALPALGVLLVGALATAALRAGGPGPLVVRAHGDRLRLALGALLVVLAVPWLFAEAGFYPPDPLLGEEVRRGQDHAAVHLGHHHGTDGVVLAAAALALSRALGTLRRRRLEAWLSGYLALMLAYGLALAVQDDWVEQVWKRGWTETRIPDVLRPDVSLAWAVIVAAAAAVELLWFRPARAGQARRRSRSNSSPHSDMGV